MSNSLTKKAIAHALERVSEKMNRIADSMECIREPGFVTHSYELRGAATQIEGWVQGILEEIGE